MLLSEPLASLITFFRTTLIKLYHNSPQMPDSFYHITESSDLDLKIRVQNILNWPCFLIFAYDANICTVQSMTS